VISSNIKSIGYDEETRIMEVEFHSGGIYQYKNVGKEVFTSFMESESKGSYFHQYVKGTFQCERIDEVPKCGQRLKDIEITTFEDGKPEKIVYSDSIRKTLENWIKIYSEDDGRADLKEKRSVLISFLKYFID